MKRLTERVTKLVEGGASEDGLPADATGGTPDGPVTGGAVGVPGPDAGSSADRPTHRER